MASPLIAVSMGDPAGIGPEIILKAAVREDVRVRCTPVVFGDAEWLARNLTRLPNRHPARRLNIAVVPNVNSARNAPRSVLPVVDLRCDSLDDIRFGQHSKVGGEASGAAIEAAVRAVMAGEADAVVTAPINKISFSLSRWGRRFVGHTEMLAAMTGAKNARLMLVHGGLRAVHVTSHIPLAEVPRAVTRAGVLDTIRVTDAALRQMGIRSPRIAVCGLNPHAGDGGVLGKEEKRVIAPAIADARWQGIRADGPLSADVVWPQVLRGSYDAGVAMYHDQGQIAIKLQGVGGVNATLALPIVRTSPAHGTAFDIAGKGRASEDSFVSAILMAVSMARQRR